MRIFKNSLQKLSLSLVLILLTMMTPQSGRSDDWPQWGGPKRDGVLRESGWVEKLPETPQYRWRVNVGAGYAGPAVAGGKVYLIDRVLSSGEKNPANPFKRSPVKGQERVLCLDSKTGNEVWTHTYDCRYTISYPSGPRATPTVDGDRVYTLGAMGHFFCLNAKNGDVIWKTNYLEDLGTEINVWGMSASPLVYGEKIILLVGGSKGRGVMALNKKTGEEVWRSSEIRDPGYAAPVIFKAGGQRQLIAWTPDVLYSINPDDGKELWNQPFKLKSNLSVATPIFDQKTHRLFVSAFYNGPLMMQMDRKSPKASVLWKGNSDSELKTDKLHALMCTPVYHEGHIYGVGSYGELRCIDANTGERKWETYEATGKDRWWNAFITPHGDKFIISNEQGELIFCNLTPKGYEELSRVKVIKPTNKVRRRMVVWSHPAYAEQAAFWRNDGELVCLDLRKK